MTVLFEILLATFIISLVSFSGALIFVFSEKIIRKYLILFVAVAAGSMLASSFIELIPESFEMFFEASVHGAEHSLFSPGLFILLGVLSFYVLEKFIKWHHHHEIDCHKHTMSKMAIVGDGFHNFIDGIVIGSAFLVDSSLGFVITFAIALHEIPQEIGDFSILLHSGMSKFKALFFNFVSGLASVLGGVLAYFFIGESTLILPFLLAFTAGSFIYIALADIVPEFSKKHEFSQNTLSLFFVLGMIITTTLITLLH